MKKPGLDFARIAALAVPGGTAVASQDEAMRLAQMVMKLREALSVIADCPPQAVHLMPLAAQAALSEGEGRDDG